MGVDRTSSINNVVYMIRNLSSSGFFPALAQQYRGDTSRRLWAGQQEMRWDRERGAQEVGRRQGSRGHEGEGEA